jgi:hypothetical protein
VQFQVWKMLTFDCGVCCAGFINPICAVAGVRRQRLALSIGPKWVSPEDRDKIQPPKRHVLSKRQEYGS